MAGLTPFSIENTDNFQRSFKKLYKNHGDAFLERVNSILEGLIDDPYPLNSRQEPLPRKLNCQRDGHFIS